MEEKDSKTKTMTDISILEAKMDDTLRFAQKRMRLRQILIEKSVMIGDFILTSGKRSNFYIDVRQTALTAEGATLIGELMFDMILKHPHFFPDTSIAAVAGMTLGADPLVTAISMISWQQGYRLPAMIIRKEEKKHGTGNFVEGVGNVRKGGYICVVDDTVTSGSSLLKTIERLEDQGFKIGLVLAICDRKEGGSEALLNRGYKLQSLFTKDDLCSCE